MSKFHLNILIILLAFALNGLTASAAEIWIPDNAPTIQAGIEMAEDGDKIMVRAGRYEGQIDFMGKNITVASDSGPQNCIINCAGQEYGFLFENGESSSALLWGFTIRNVLTAHQNGGAIRIVDSSPTIANCRITGNAVYFNVLNANDGVSGGGVYCENSSSTFFNCLIVENICYNNILWNTHPVAGAMGAFNSNITILASTIIDNWATSISNGATNGIHGIGCNFSIQGCIIRNTSQDLHPSDAFDVEYSNIENENITGTGVIHDDPLFTPGPQGNYYLSHIDCGQEETSLCINAWWEPSLVICYPSPNGTECLANLVTQTGNSLDSGYADMGYHHLQASSSRGVRIDMPDCFFQPEDNFFIDAYIYNNDDPMISANLFAILEISGEFFFWDDWTTKADFQLMEIPTGMLRITIIPQFAWPDTGTLLMNNLVIYGAITDAGITRIIGDFWTCHFGFGPNYTE